MQYSGASVGSTAIAREPHIRNQPFRNTHFVIKIFGCLDINIEDFRSSSLGPTRAASFSVIAPESKSQVLQKRLVKFASQIIHVSANLPKTPEGIHISKQMLRSGTGLLKLR
jgi:hypothetical protein